MAEREIDTMDQFLTMTYTIADQRRHDLAVATRNAAENSLRERLGFALVDLRAALSKLN